MTEVGLGDDASAIGPGEIEDIWHAAIAPMAAKISDIFFRSLDDNRTYRSEASAESDAPGGGLDLRVSASAETTSQRYLPLDDAHPHQLCGLCSKIDFSPTLHGKDECASIGCRYLAIDYVDGRPLGGQVSTHSLEHRHYPSQEALRVSAGKGCHLCNLIIFGLQNASERLTYEGRNNYSLNLTASRYGPAQHNGEVTLVYHKSSKGEEELEVFCKDLVTALPIATASPRKCSEEGFSEFGCGDDGRVDSPPRVPANARARFYAKCIRGYKEESKVNEGPSGFPVVSEYVPGQVISVYAVNGKFWLAALVNGDSKDRFGWVDSGDYTRLSKPPHPYCDCGKGVWEPPLLGVASGGQSAYLEADPLSEETFSTIRRWMSSCADGHAICRPPYSTSLPHRVVDVGKPGAGGIYPDPFLSIGEDRLGQYATLSYRWWSGPTLTTTLSTIGSRKEGIPLASMPQTFQDAVTVTRRLGIKYLWIDALCVIQDSPQDWQRQSSNMGQIYADAWLNISVSGAPDPWTGFLKKRNPLQISSCRHPLLLSSSPGAAVSATKVICPIVPRHDRIIDRDALNSRGWILQEHVLSKRTLHFGLFEIVWECLSLWASEREPEVFETKTSYSRFSKSPSPFDADSRNRKHKWDIIRSGIQYLRNQNAEELLDLLGPEEETRACHDEQHIRWVLRNLSKTPRERIARYKPCLYCNPVCALPPSPTVGQFLAAHHLWYLLVEEYTLRFLTKPNDILPAVSGMARIFQRVFGLRSKYIAGIWSGDILNGLTWKRVRQSHMGHSRSPAVGPGSNQAPSFSWASINGPVSFSVVQRNLLTGEDDYSAQVLEVDSTTAGLDSFGEVSEGFLKLRARTIPLHCLIENTIIPTGTPFDYDDPSLQLSNKQILCASIRHRRDGDMVPYSYFIFRQCLLLLPLVPGGNVYRRVGFWEQTLRGPTFSASLIRGAQEVYKHLKCGLTLPPDVEPDQPFLCIKGPPYEGWEEQDVTIV